MNNQLCFAYQKDSRGIERCRALKQMECANCKFYKSQKQIEQETRMIFKRLAEKSQDS